MPVFVTYVKSDHGVDPIIFPSIIVSIYYIRFIHVFWWQIKQYFSIWMLEVFKCRTYLDIELRFMCLAQKWSVY